MAVFAWKEDYKLMKSMMDKYKSNESNTWALIYSQTGCHPSVSILVTPVFGHKQELIFLNI
jgi:hypothetical protein